RGGVLGSHEHPTLDTVHVSMRSDIVRIRPGDECYGGLVDLDLGSVERAYCDHICAFGLYEYRFHYDSQVGRDYVRVDGIRAPSFDRTQIAMIVAKEKCIWRGCWRGKSRPLPAPAAASGERSRSRWRAPAPRC